MRPWCQVLRVSSVRLRARIHRDAKIPSHVSLLSTASTATLNAVAVQDPELSRRERNTLRTRRQIVRAACELVLEDGYERATITRIAERADLATRTVTTRFASKEDIFFGGMDEHVDRAEQHLRSGGGDTIDRLRAWIDDESARAQAQPEDPEIRAAAQPRDRRRPGPARAARAPVRPRARRDRQVRRRRHGPRGRRLRPADDRRRGGRDVRGRRAAGRRGLGSRRWPSSSVGSPCCAGR